MSSCFRCVFSFFFFLVESFIYCRNLNNQQKKKVKSKKWCFSLPSTLLSRRNIIYFWLKSIPDLLPSARWFHAGWMWCLWTVKGQSHGCRKCFSDTNTPPPPRSPHPVLPPLFSCTQLPLCNCHRLKVRKSPFPGVLECANRQGVPGLPITVRLFALSWVETVVVALKHPVWLLSRRPRRRCYLQTS